MGILSWIIIGGLAGWIASMIMKTDENQGIIGNIVVGVIGAFIGGAFVNIISPSENPFGMDFNLETFLVALLGAVILLWLIKMVRGGKSAK